jgi:hypothetical protein
LAQKHNELGGQEQRKAKWAEDRGKEELFDLEEVEEDADGLMNTLAETWSVRFALLSSSFADQYIAP